MQFFLPLLLVSLTVQLSVAPPVTQNKKDDKHTKENEIEDSEDMSNSMEYRRYLTEVVETLESDPDFRAKLEKADEADIRTGKIAEQLAFVSHNIRTKLDELKRGELERLRHLFSKQSEVLAGLGVVDANAPEHLDHVNTRTFEIEDLRKLIEKTTKDLAEADRTRREEFKQHEMEMKFEEEQKLKSNDMNDSDRKKYDEDLKALKEKHKQHEPVHHPGSKQQLEEVWEKQDHMDTEDFNPRTFFFLHDVDGNGLWDQDEVKALFLKELDKLYAQGATHEELLKRTEEMERMREHVFNEADINKDGFISYDEFLEQTRNPEFQRDEGWEPLDEQQIYTQEEFEEFEKHKQEELQRMIAKGMPPPHPGNIPAHQEPFPPHGVPQAQYPQHQQQQQHVQMSPQQQYHPQMPQAHLPEQQYHPPIQHQQPHPGQMTGQHQQQQQLPGQMPGQHQQPHPGMPPVQALPVHQQQQHPGVVPVQQQQQHPGVVPVPQQQQHPEAVPVVQQQQQHPGVVPVQQHPGVVPVQQQQQHPEAVPVVQQQQQHPGVVPVQQHPGVVPVHQQQQQQPPLHNAPNPSFQQHPNTQNEVPQIPHGSNTH